MYVSVHEHAAHSTPESLAQSYLVCELEDKITVLFSFIRNHLKHKVIVFMSSCKQVNSITNSVYSINQLKFYSFLTSHF